MYLVFAREAASGRAVWHATVKCQQGLKGPVCARSCSPLQPTSALSELCGCVGVVRGRAAGQVVYDASRGVVVLVGVLDAAAGDVFEVRANATGEQLQLPAAGSSTKQSVVLNLNASTGAIVSAALLSVPGDAGDLLVNGAVLAADGKLGLRRSPRAPPPLLPACCLACY